MIQEQAATAERDGLSLAAARALVSNCRPGRFAIFDEVGEGEMFPDGTESMSGHVVFGDGRVFFFWVDWDAQGHGPTLGTWAEVTDEMVGEPDGEYAEALAEVDRLGDRRLRTGASG